VRTSSVRSLCPSMPYMTCNDPSGPRSLQRSSIHRMNAPASDVYPSLISAYSVKDASRIQV
jgi:hypothetical protein